MNDLLDFAHSTARWWRRPRVQRASRALLILWLVNDLIGTITEKWWCDALGVGALWTARTFAQTQLFCATALLGGLILSALVFFLTPHAAKISPFDRRSVLARGVAAYAQFGRRATWQIGAMVVLWQSRRAAMWGDEWLLWHSGQNWGERDLSGLDWSAWLWNWPLFDGLNRVLWSSVSLALLAGFALHAGQIALAALRREDERALSCARRLLWLLGALWFFCLGARYVWLYARNAVAWHGDDALVPVGWDWLSWHWTRLTDSGGVALAACGVLVCVLAMLRPASTCRAYLRPAWGAALLTWCLPGTLQVLAGGPLWRLVVAPDQSACEAPFIALHRQSTQRAWRVDLPTHVVRAQEVGMLTATERAALAQTARVWDEDTLQAALGTKNQSVAPSLNRENHRLVAVTTQGVYDATRAVAGQPPQLRAFAADANWPHATTSEASGDIVLSGVARVFWAWRLRDFGALWRKYATLHTDWNGRAQALLPGARTVAAPYLTPDGYLIQNLSGTTLQLPGVWRAYDERGEVAQLSDAAYISISPAGKTQLWAGHGDGIWTRTWRQLAGESLQTSTAAPAGTRASKSVAQTRVRVWNRLIQAQKPHWSGGELEYALLAEPNSQRARWILQGTIREPTRLAGWLEIDAGVGEAEDWRVWEIAPSLPRTEPLWPLNEEALDEERTASGSGTEVKTARVRGKVLVAPLWRSGLSRDGNLARAALLLWQDQYAAPAAFWLPSQIMPLTGWSLERMALSDATREERVAVGRSVSELLNLWSHAPAATSAPAELLAARHVAQELSRLLEAEETALRSGDWAKAEILRDQQRAILDNMK